MQHRLGKGWTHDQASNTFYDSAAKAVWSPSLRVAVDVYGGVYKRGQRLPPESVPEEVKGRLVGDLARARKFFSGGSK